MMRVHGFRKSFGSTLAVDSVSFEARDGLVTGLLGPNGAGKTTTLRALSGLLRPDKGTVTVDGHDATTDPAAARRHLGLLTETFGLYDRLTVREHLAYAGALHGLPRQRRDERVETVIDQFRLRDIAERRAGTLSFGQRRRVGLARALVHDPGNVVLDEPTNGLDVLAIRDVRREIRRMAEWGCAVIVSSHVMPEIAATCDRVVVLARGRVVADATPDDLLARTTCGSLEDAFVRLIGSEEGLN